MLQMKINFFAIEFELIDSGFEVTYLFERSTCFGLEIFQEKKLLSRLGQIKLLISYEGS